jgi:hypothetical protein
MKGTMICQSGSAKAAGTKSIRYHNDERHQSGAPYFLYAALRIKKHKIDE